MTHASLLATGARMVALSAALWALPPGALAGLPQQPDFQQGLHAVQTADFTSALFHFQVLAAQGHAAAQYNLALMYAHGLGVPRNPALATNWAHKAADAGYTLAKDWLSRSPAQSR